MYQVFNPNKAEIVLSKLKLLAKFDNLCIQSGTGTLSLPLFPDVSAALDCFVYTSHQDKHKYAPLSQPRTNQYSYLIAIGKYTSLHESGW